MFFKARLINIKIVAYLLIATVCLTGQQLYAAYSGKIVGTITDKSTREPLAPVNVWVKGTDYGASTDFDGRFTIMNVPPGEYSVEVSMVGYHTMTFTGVMVNIDLTTELNAQLTPDALQLEEVVVKVKPPAVRKDVSSKMARMDKQKLNLTRPESMEGILSITTGFKIDPEGKMHVRGGRSGDAAILVEGVDLRDPLVDTQINLQLSAASVDEVNVLTGGFNAEYGRVMSGVIQIKTAEGAPKGYKGRMEFQTDRIIENYSFDTDRLELSIGGPVPFTQNLFWRGKPMTFFFSGITQLTNTYTPFDIDREPNDYLGIGIPLPERQMNAYQGSLKLGYPLTDKKRLSLYLTAGYNQWDIYPNGEGGVSGNYGYNYKYNLENRPWAFQRNFSGTLSFTDNISSSTFYELKAIVFSTRSMVQPRTKDPGQFTMQDAVENGLANAFDRNRNGILDPDEYTDSDGDGFMDGFWDYNGNNIFDGGGEGYEDLNMNGRWDRGEDWVDLNGNGIYDAAEPWVDVANPLTGENNIGVWDPWDPYVDINSNGRWDPAEPQLPEHDWNGNGTWDGERFIDANANGKFDSYEPWEDLNGNFLWDEGEPFYDTNGNGKFDYGEGYADKNRNGMMDRRDLQTQTGSADLAEPFIDGDFFWDTGEPFIDEPDPITGLYNGKWDAGEIWFDLPSSSNSQTGAGLYRLGNEMTLNGKYDGPNGLFDEYELFTKPAVWSPNADPSRPVIYSYNEEARGTDWPADIFRFINGKSTWINNTLNDKAAPRFSLRNFRVDEGEEWYQDYNGNGKWDATDGFINPGMWDAVAYWYDRQSTEYTFKGDIQSQVGRFHEMKGGIEMKYRDLQMQSLERPDLPYTGEAQLPEGSAWPDRGGVRDFYKYRPWEGAVYVQDKMEFEGLILNAGIRYDFIIHDQEMVEEFRERMERDEPGAIYAQRGTWRLSPRLGISHPITETSKLYFNYGHFYQAPSFSYFYKSATANLTINSAIGNPNLEYEKTIQYELGVSTQITEALVFDISGYYKDQYDLISTSDERWKNLTLDRFANLDYGRMRGFELSIEKRPSDHWAMTFNYDFSYAYGKASDQKANQDARLKNIPYNYDEHPLAWDETHKINAYLTILYDKGDYPRLFGITMPDDWMATLQWEFGSGLPYTPSIYTTGIDNANLILPNSARYPWRERTTFKFEKYYSVSLFGRAEKQENRLFFGFTVNNVFNRRNVQSLYAETGSPTQPTHPLNPTYNPNNNFGEYNANPRNFEPGRNVLFRVGLSF